MSHLSAVEKLTAVEWNAPELSAKVRCAFHPLPCAPLYTPYSLCARLHTLYTPYTPYCEPLCTPYSVEVRYVLFLPSLAQSTAAAKILSRSIPRKQPSKAVNLAKPYREWVWMCRTSRQSRNSPRSSGMRRNSPRKCGARPSFRVEGVGCGVWGAGGVRWRV